MPDGTHEFSQCCFSTFLSDTTLFSWECLCQNGARTWLVMAAGVLSSVGLLCLEIKEPSGSGSELGTPEAARAVSAIPAAQRACQHS